MRQWLVTILLLGCACNVSGQVGPFHHYKTEDAVNNVKYYKDSVVIKITTSIIDSASVKEAGKTNRLERKITTIETRTYQQNKIKSAWKVSGNLTYFVGGVQMLTVALNAPGFIDTLWRPMDDRVPPVPTDYKVPATGQLEIMYHSEKDTSFLSKGQRKNIYFSYYFRKYKQIRFFIGAGYSAQAAYRMVLVNDPQFSQQSILDSRHSNESASYGYAVMVPVGIQIGRRHNVYAEYLHSNQGFKSKHSSIDWNTGLPLSSTANRQYKFRYNGFGIGYTNSGYRNRVNGVFDVGLSMIFLHRFKDGVLTLKDKSIALNSNTIQVKRQAIVGKFGLGLNYMIKNEWWVVRVVPTIQYNFTPVNSETLKTRLYSIGATAGIYFRINKWFAAND